MLIPKSGKGSIGSSKAAKTPLPGKLMAGAWTTFTTKGSDIGRRWYLSGHGHLEPSGSGGPGARRSRPEDLRCLQAQDARHPPAGRVAAHQRHGGSVRRRGHVVREYVEVRQGTRSPA